jgi:hypothetical protein
LLEEPVKLPVLNIELPLVGFFFLAPILFVIFHAYVLLQVLLLGRTAAAYNEAVEHTIKVAADNVRVRQRLANTLFAQIFAGSPRERDGWLGWLLKAMAWITLAIGFVSLSLFTFPGEPHVNTFAGQPLDTVQCERWFNVTIDEEPAEEGSIKKETPIHLRYWAQWQIFDRLILPRVDVVDDEALKKIEEHTKAAGEHDYQGERTQLLRGRDFSCADLSDYADLRRVDLTNASLRGASFKQSKLQGASLDGAELQGASLDGAELQGASLDGAELQGASLREAQLQGAYLNAAKLQGALLNGARLSRCFPRRSPAPGHIPRWNQPGGRIPRRPTPGRTHLDSLGLSRTGRISRRGSPGCRLRPKFDAIFGIIRSFRLAREKCCVYES